ncbi:c-type cytochrome [Deinococcus ruber]|uniref:Cytochrome c n=1 Tax=Deinococcus ruber TaxID=1848197 RepID=A0A918F8J4_9DEIO|nr:c-type cytochrome [Deinococcus ruber]GGR10548.1 cytochrome c [Deinococcus ruber]
MRYAALPAAALGLAVVVAGAIYALRPAAPPEYPMPVGVPMSGSHLVDAHYCADCHGGKGQPTNASIPSLAGQQAAFLYKNMLRFHHRQGNIPNVRVTSMINVFPGLTSQQIADIASYYTAQKPVDAWPPVAGSELAVARRLYLDGDSNRQVVACQVCHGVSGRGDAGRGTPALLHQSPGYALTYLQTVRASVPTDQAGQNAMHTETQHLSDDELKNLANYLATLTPKEGQP